jgi:capsular polysaccharide export protein
MGRSFLVLQGTASPFFSRLAVALRGRGHTVRRVNFCGGDLVYSGKGTAWNFAGRPHELPGWYANVVRTESVTDVLMFGDCREVHRHMHAVSQAHGLNVHVFEEGYVRPHWFTLERHGVNGRSKLSRDPAWYLAERHVTPHRRIALPTGYNLHERVYHDIRYRAANAVHRMRFPHYRSHRPQNGFVEYSGLAARALRQRRYDREAEKATHELFETGRPFYLFPLQLSPDSQIVHHSPFDNVRQALDMVLRSFAAHAPSYSCLVVKNHPLDTGLMDYRRYVRRLADDLAISSRVRFIDAGHLPALLNHARGVVVVNSTTGISALYHKRPLVALGTAMYCMPGLTWQHGLDSFWEGGEAPDLKLFDAFLDYVIHHTQINGDFYTRTGIEMATAGTVERLEAAYA